MTADKLNRAMLVTITAAVLYMTYIAHSFYADVRLAKAEANYLAHKAEACRLRQAIAPGAQC